MTASRSSARFLILDYVLSVVPFMRGTCLSIFSEPSLIGPSADPIDSRFRIVSQRRLPRRGADSRPGQDGGTQDIRISGWAWDTSAERPASEIIVASNGRVVGLGAIGRLASHDPATRTYMNTSFVGFTAYAKTSGSTPVDSLRRNQGQSAASLRNRNHRHHAQMRH